MASTAARHHRQSYAPHAHTRLRRSAQIIPLRPAAEPDAPALPGPGIAVSAPGHEVLIIEDEHKACEILQRVLAEAAHRKGLKFGGVAARAGVCESTVRKIAYGETTSPKIRTCILIGFALGLHMLWLKPLHE